MNTFVYFRSRQFIVIMSYIYACVWCVCPHACVHPVCVCMRVHASVHLCVFVCAHMQAFENVFCVCAFMREIIKYDLYL